MMKRWNQTTIEWDLWNCDDRFGVGKAITNIPISMPVKNDAEFYIFESIKVVSQIERVLCFIIRINRGEEYQSPYGGVKGCEDGDLGEIWKILQKLGEIQGSIAHDFDTGESFLFRLPLRRGELFCERSIELVGEIFQLFGVQDLRNKFRGNFLITQTTQVWNSGRWRDYRLYLKSRYNLHGKMDPNLVICTTE